jgi:thiol-disulfide isomerase/thioredoxin
MILKKTSISLVLWLLLCIPNVLAQPWSIKATIRNSQKKAYLMSYRGDRFTVIDSTGVDEKGVIYFAMKGHYPQGLYKVSFSKYPNNKNWDITLLYDHENIELASGYGLPADSMKIIQSAQNKVYYEFLTLENRINKQMMVLSDMVSLFPPKDPFYSSIANQFNELKKQKLEFVNKNANQLKGTLVVSVIKTQMLQPYDFTMDRETRLIDLKTRFFDHAVFMDTLLLNTNIITTKAFNYLQLYTNPQLKKDVQAVEYIKATDSIMKYTSVNEKVRVQVAEYLLRGFEQLNMDTALHHLYTNYIETQGCENTQTPDRIKLRIEGNRKLPIGSKAPEINMVDNDSNKVALSAIKSQYTLVIFWSATCPHCLAMLPALKKIYSSQTRKNIEILAISIDTDVVGWHNALSFGAYPWINCCDTKGWEGEAAKDYFVYATPTIFLLDAEKRIIAKPIQIGELIPKLAELKIVEKDNVN